MRFQARTAAGLAALRPPVSAFVRLCAFLFVLDNAFNIPLFKLLCVLCVSQRAIGSKYNFLFVSITEIVFHKEDAGHGVDLAILHIIDHLKIENFHCFFYGVRYGGIFAHLDGIEQFIQSLLILKGVDIESEEYKALRENGGLKVPLEGDAYYVTQELNQTQTQTLVDYMYQTILVICGMPNRNGGSSTSDTGSAVIMRDGWSDAEARAKDTELMFKMSEKRFLRLAIGTITASTTVDLDTIDRSAPTVSVSASVVSTSSITVKGTASKNCNRWDYSLDGGSSWTNLSTSNGTSASKTLTGLLPKAWR